MKTTNFENSKKLHEVGFKAKTIFAHSINNPQWGVQSFVIDIGIEDGYYPSYDLETILEALIMKHFLDYQDEVCLIKVAKEDNESLADTAARLLIALAEQKIINFK